MKRDPGPRLPRAVWILGLTSLLTDASSEMIYPLLPLYLATALGAGPVFLGVIEGAAEATASLLKLASGWWADRVVRRKPLVVAGYAISAIARPLIAIASTPIHVLSIRVFDRIGKGIRSSPRDAMIGDVTAPEARGRAYGIHRAMDHAGAVVGPLLAAGALAVLGDGVGPLRTVFALAAIPGVLAVVVLVVSVREPERHDMVARTDLAGTERLPADFWRLLAVLLLFTLGNSSDAFLLLRASDLGVPAHQLPILWVAHHVVKSALSGAFGGLSDRLGRRGVIVAGWVVYSVSYVLFAWTTTALGVWLVFCLYGVYFALTEGSVKAMVADLAPPASRGRAFGLYNMVVGLGALPASLTFGAIWQKWGAATALATGAGLALVSALLLATVLGSRGRAVRRGPG